MANNNFSMVDKDFWVDQKIQAISEDAKFFFLYILTSPHSDCIGFFRLTDGYILSDMKWNEKRLAKAKQELVKNNMCKFDGKNVLVINYLRYHKPAAVNNVKGFIKNIEKVKFSPLIGEFKKVLNKYIVEPNQQQALKELNAVLTTYEPRSNPVPTSSEYSSNPLPTDIDVDIEEDIDVDEEIEREKDADIEEKVDARKDTVMILLEAYHKILPMLPKTKLINAEIKKNAAELLKEVKPEAIIETFKMIPKCNHLIGKNDRGWQATFGWLMKPVNYAKVVNGNYLKSDKLPDVKPDAYNAQLNFLMNSVKKDYENERMATNNEQAGTEENFYDHIVYGSESQICNR